MFKPLGVEYVDARRLEQDIPGRIRPAGISTPLCSTTLKAELCFNLVADLSKRWDGVLWHNPDPTAEERRFIAELTGRRFLYRRVGYDERPMRLEANNKVGEGAAECERRWDVNIDDGRAILTLSRLDHPTCHLQRNSNAVRTGQWLEFERMPVEFIPLEA